MKILIVGSGGREHALLQKIQSSPKVSEIFVAPGNGGMQTKATCVDIAADNIPELVKFAKEKNIDLTIVGPELPLTLGLVDAMQKEGLRCFGPSERASLIEGSKVYTKQFCSRHHIPTAPFMVFHDPEHAKAYVAETPSYPVVIKADGLAAGKGVIIANNLKEAHQAIDDLLVNKKFGKASEQIVIEDFLQGQEASFFVLTDGTRFVEFPIAQDHKRVFDNDEGPNTGGMGAYAPAPFVTPALKEKIRNKIVMPTLVGLKEENRKFVGFLYVGLMIDAEGNPFVVEYNCRLGDPETQVVLPLLKTDLIDLIEKALDKNLPETAIEFENKTAATVVLASGGYPETYKKGFLISGLDADFPENVHVFHAGTDFSNGEYKTQGGRVLAVTALADNLQNAVNTAYDNVKKIHWDGMHYRKDIAKKAL